MSELPLIQVKAVSKRFPVTRKRGGRLRRQPQRQRVVLNGVDLEVKRGDSLAVLGSNGAGKSTLLKIIAGIHHPTGGEVVVRGTLGALIELGAGFHSEHDAIDNLRAGATLMGVDERFVGTIVEQALAFSGIAEHAKKPLKHYSSGMVVRLGFSLVAAVRPDVLITDEVLAVGDEAFQKRCIGWLESYLEAGGTLLLVSHNLYHVQKLCGRAAWLHQGRIEAQGETFEVVQRYLAHHEADPRPDAAAHGHNGLHRLDLGWDDGPAGVLQPGSRAPVSIEAEGGTDLVVRLRRLSGELLWEATATVAADGVLKIALPTQRLLPGRYLVEAARTQSPGGLKKLFRVAGATRKFGSIEIEHHWS